MHNCWGTILVNGATSLNIYEGNLNSSNYKDILTQHIPEMEEIFPEGYFFQHDNLSVHQSCENWMEDEGARRIQFPTYSPDLTPIENLWHSLKSRVRRDLPRTKESSKR